jgi:hypothetical protein
MEEVLLNIDSKYRNMTQYPNESKFTIYFDKTYKNIIAAKMISIEMINNVNYIDSSKSNNYITIHLPNKLNDPDGTLIQLEDGLLQLIQSIQNNFNFIFNNTFNSNNAIQLLQNIEKYFYIFYLNNNITIVFDFNTATVPTSLNTSLVITSGWYSVYGFFLLISNYITLNYNNRKTYVSNNIGAIPINLDNGNFVINQFTINVFDRRFRSIVANIPTIHDCIRMDNFIPSNTYTTNNLLTNINKLKQEFYKLYIYDDITFIPQTTGSIIPTINWGILDKLINNIYLIPIGNNYINEGTNLISGSKYYTNSNYLSPTGTDSQIYNLLMSADLTTETVSFINSFTNITTNNCQCNQIISSPILYYFWTDPLNVTPSTWNNNKTNLISSLLFKSYLLSQKFITQAQYNNPLFIPNLSKDIAPFDINFQTCINKSYPSVGYYLGYRSNNNSYLLSSVWNKTNALIAGTKRYNTSGDNYIFIKINDWGYFDLFNKQLFGKILLNNGLGKLNVDDYILKEYRFRQPINVQKLEIELVDYLGNPVNLNGNDFSFTLVLFQVFNTDYKYLHEERNLIFRK